MAHDTRLRSLLGTLLPLILAGCAASTTTPPASDVPGAAWLGDALAPLARTGDGLEGAVGGYTITVDGESADIAPWRTALANDDLFLLGIDQFLKPSSLRITGISRSTGRLNLAWRFVHPFAPANSFDSPSTAGNRSDLGVAARLLLLADVGPANLAKQTFFGDVVANTAILKNADGYMQPGGLFAAGVANANCFPYQLVVNETANAGQGNRDQANSAGVTTGNYDAGNAGWQRANAGPNRDAWTGYDIIHQGQASSGTFALDIAPFLAGPVAFNVAVVVKYNDPRGVPEPYMRRLPAAEPDPFQFAYRMPHGALDVGQVLVTPPGALGANDPEATVDVAVRVRDWDARATVSTATNLSLDPAVDTVVAGEEGIPTVEISTPGVSAAIPTGVEQEVGVHTGAAGDEIPYLVTVTATSMPTVGSYPALVRVSDPVLNSAAYRDYTTDLDPNLAPITDPLQQVKPVTYAAMTLTVIAGGVDCPDVTSNGPTLGPFIYEEDVNPDYWEFSGEMVSDIDALGGVGTCDLAGIRDLSGEFIVQGNISQRFWRVDAESVSVAALTAEGYPGPGFANRAHTYEIDSHDRVFWVASNIVQNVGNPGLETEEIYPNAGTVIHFFDTDGMATADTGSIEVGERVVAMAIDGFDNLWALDATNTMHKYTGPAGGTSYTEDLAALFNLTTASGGGLAGMVVEDFDINFYNQAFFVLVKQSPANFTAWRFECDGTYNASVQGGANPAVDLFDGEPCDRGDIVIDNYDSAMAHLQGPQDSQIVITGDNGSGPEELGHDGGTIITLTAKMESSSVEIGEDGHGRASFLYGIDIVVTTESLSDDEWAEDWTEVWMPPAGWQ